MSRRLAVSLTVLMGAAAPAFCADAADDEPGVKLTLGLRELYDDNLYRLPDTGAPRTTRDDYIRRLSAGLDGNWQWSRQKVSLELLAANNAYQRNDQLDNTAGHARTEWEWRAGKLWSGALGGDFNRTLASFSNTQFLGKDLIDTTGTFASLGFHLSPRWSLKAAGRRASTEHSASARRFDDFQTDSMTAGLHYETPADTEIGFDVRRTEGHFNRPLNLAGQSFDRDYEDESINLAVNKVYSPRTRLEFNVGYLSRAYADAALADLGKGSFAGPIGDLLLQWQASNKIALNLNGWRHLRAYLDAESDYFVSEGISVAPTWEPTGKVSVALELGYETQDYLGASVDLPRDARSDRLRTCKLQIGYGPLRNLHFDLTGNLENRESDRVLLGYDSQVVSVGVRWTY